MFLVFGLMMQFLSQGSRMISRPLPLHGIPHHNLGFDATVCAEKMGCSLPSRPQGPVCVHPCDICCQRHVPTLLYALTLSSLSIKHAHAYSRKNKHSSLQCVPRQLGPCGSHPPAWPL